MISGTEYLVIVLAIFLVFGPGRLPEMSREAGRWLRKCREMLADLRSAVEIDIESVQGPIDQVVADLSGGEGVDRAD